MRTAYVLLSDLTTGDIVRLGGHDVRVRNVHTRDGQVTITGTNTTRGAEWPPHPMTDMPVQIWRGDHQR